MPLVVEKDVERRLKSRVERFGGRCIKFFSSSETGIPDRIVLLPLGRIAFVELKRPKGGRPSEMQKYQAQRLRRLGFPVWFVKNYDEVEEMLRDTLGADYRPVP